MRNPFLLSLSPLLKNPEPPTRNCPSEAPREIPHPFSPRAGPYPRRFLFPPYMALGRQAPIISGKQPGTQCGWLLRKRLDPAPAHWWRHGIPELRAPLRSRLRGWPKGHPYIPLPLGLRPRSPESRSSGRRRRGSGGRMGASLCSGPVLVDRSGSLPPGLAIDSPVS